MKNSTVVTSLWVFMFLVCCIPLQAFSADNIYGQFIKDKRGDYHLITGNRMIDSGYAYVGMHEIGETNLLPDKRIQKSTGAIGLAWCASFVRFLMDITGMTSPNVRSAMAIRYKTNRSIRASDVYMGFATVPKGSAVIWNTQGTSSGHIGVTTKTWKGKSGESIQGNTKQRSQNVEEERNGGSVEVKTNSISLYAKYRIVAFTPVSYQ